jgi:hypothetical protein
MTGACNDCKHELGYYEKLWICGCKCNTNWQPVEVVVERKETPVAKTTKPRASTASRKKEADAVSARTSISEGDEPTS